MRKQSRLLKFLLHNFLCFCSEPNSFLRTSQSELKDVTREQRSITSIDASDVQIEWRLLTFKLEHALVAYGTIADVNSMRASQIRH